MASQTQLVPPQDRRQPQNLWQRALETLDDDLKASLDFKKSTKRHILTSVLKTAEEKKQLCLRKRWKFKKSNGEEVILRDIMEKIIVWLEKFKAVGDVAVQYDPVHSSLPWASVRFLLQVAVSDKQVFGATVEGLETITHLISRYAIFEDLYMQRNTAVSSELEEMLTRLYADVLVFLAKAKKYFQTSTAVRLMKSAFQSDEDQQMQKIVTQSAKISSLAVLSDAEIQRDNNTAVHNLLKDLEKPTSRLVDQAAVYAKALEENKYREVLCWLSPVSFVRHHERHSETRIPGSGKWLLDHPQYLSWKSSSTSLILLLHGIMGSGKTSLASAVVDSFLEESSKQTSPAPTAYFYCAKNASEVERANPEEIMRSIVRQLTLTDHTKKIVHEALLNEYERRKAEAKIDGLDLPRLRIEECIKLILNVTGSNPAAILIDALDEVQEGCRHELVDALNIITRESGSVVKVFITSRDDSNVLALLSNTPKIRINSHDNNADMELFVRHRVNRAIRGCNLLSGSVSKDLKEDLVNALIDGAGEMFLWVSLQIDKLCRMQHELDIRRAMRKLSKDSLKQLYDEAFRKVFTAEPFARSIAIKSFSFLLCMQETLSPAAFLAAIAGTDPNHQSQLKLPELLTICFNMVVLDSKSNVLRFAHVSVQEFLEAQPDLAAHHTHRLAAMSCLKTCMHGSPVGPEIGLLPTENFYHYSALYWAEHYKAAAITDEYDNLFQMLRDFVYDDNETSLSLIGWLDDAQEYSNALANHHPLKKALSAVTSLDHTPLFTACVFGFASLLNDITQANNFDWNQTNVLGQTGLYLASAKGHEKIASLFIDHGADVNASGGRHGRPLQAACFAGHTAVVQLLLDHGADPKLSGRSDNALQASLLGDKEEVALLVVGNGFSIATQNDYDISLRQAAQAGHAKVVRLLQKTYALSFGDSGPAQCKAIEAAIVKGRLGVLKRFLWKSPDSEHHLPSDAVSTAALGGHDHMVLLLLDKGLEIERQGPFGTPLRAASLMGHESTVRILLERGAKIGACGYLGDALQAAAMKGHVLITKLLLQEGADPNNHGGYYGNALQAAAYHGYKNAVEVLLDAGADVRQEGLSRDAFHAAAEGGHEEIVRLFLENGFQFCHESLRQHSQHVEAVPSRYKNLLRDASPSRAKKSREFHVDQPKSPNWQNRAPASDFHHILGASRNVQEIEGTEHAEPYRRDTYQHYPRDEENYALQAAASKGRNSVVRLILDRWDSLDISSVEVRNALTEASKNGHEYVVRLLTTSRLDMVSHLEGALKEAASHGHVAVVDMLLAYEEASKPEDHRKPQACTTTAQAQDFVIPSSDQATAKHRIEHAKITLIAGCRGGHVPVVIRALNLIYQHESHNEMGAIHTEALYEAAKHNSSSVMKVLLKRGTQFEREGLFNAFDVACESGQSRAVLCLLTDNTSRNLFGLQECNKRLEKATKKGNSELVLCLVQHFSEASQLKISEEAVATASGHGFADIVRLLVEKVTISESRHNPLNHALNLAALNGHTEVVELLIREGGDVNAVAEEISSPYSLSFWPPIEGLERRSNALQAAVGGCSSGSFRDHYLMPSSWHKADATAQEATIHLLLEKGADVNELAGCPAYPLYDAAAHCSERVIQSIIDKGAVLDKSASEGETALKSAAGREDGSAAIMKLLLQAGAVIPASEAGRNPALNSALAFFRAQDLRSRDWGPDGNFIKSKSVNDVLENGPGAVVKMLLPRLPMEKADKEEYGLLLQMAVVAGDYECVDLLLQRQVNVNIAGCYYGSALQAAARVGNVKLVQLLLGVGADINLIQGEHSTALRAAVLGSHEEVVDILIEHGADINLRFPAGDHRGENYKSVLHLSLDTGNVAIVKSLIAAGADVTLDQPRVLTAACGSGDIKMVQLLLDSGADVNASGKGKSYWAGILDKEATALHMASEKGHESVARVLLEHGADTEKEVECSGTPLQLAASAGHVSLVEVLIETGTKIDRNNSHGTALSIASANGHLGVVQSLISAGASIADPLRVPNALAAACRCRHRSIIELLLEELSGTECEEFAHADAQYADTQYVARAGNDDGPFRLPFEYGTARYASMILRQACAAGSMDSVRALLKSGVDINDGHGDGSHVLHTAACHQRSRVVQLLVDRGADVNLQSTRYGSPLLAALEGCAAPKLRRWATAEPANTLARALPLPDPLFSFRFFETGSSGPSYKGTIECERILQTLVDHEADVNTVIRSFGNAVHLASFIGSEAILRMLLDKGADVHSTGGYFETALLAALEGNHPAIVELLLSSGINVNHPSSKHGTALHYACLKQSEAIVRTLLNHGADVNAVNGQHGSPLSAATSWRGRIFEREGDNRAIVDLLLQCGDKLQIRECDLVAAAARVRYPCSERYLKLFLEHDNTIQITEPVIIAAAKGLCGSDGTETFQLLLERDGGLGVTETMLEAAAKPEIMKMLLDHRPICRVTPNIFVAAGQNSPERRQLLQLLFNHEPDMPITEAVMITALESYNEFRPSGNFIKLLFERKNELQVTKAMLKAAKSSNEMRTLLEHAPE